MVRWAGSQLGGSQPSLLWRGRGSRARNKESVKPKRAAAAVSFVSAFRVLGSLITPVS